MAKSVKDINIFSGLGTDTTPIHNNPTQQEHTTHTNNEDTQAKPTKPTQKKRTQRKPATKTHKTETDTTRATQTPQETTQGGWGIQIPKKQERRSERLQLVVTPSLMRRIGAQADAYGVSRNELIHLVLEQFCDHQEGRGK